MTKTCARCKAEKSTQDYGFTHKTSDGLKSYCKPCETEYQRERRARDPKVRVKDNLHSKAWSRAATRLSYQHAEEFRKILNEERTALGLAPHEDAS